jgi:ribosomal protein L37AE/L43A
MSRAAAPLYCPFCCEEDLRPVEDDPAAWSCRACAHVFAVQLVRIDHAAIPANRPSAAAGGRS